MTTLKEALQAIQAISILPHKKSHIADDLLGKYKNILPPGKTSNDLIKDLRNTHRKEI